MMGLAIHTCSPELGLAMGSIEGEIRHQSWDLGRDLAAQLHSILIEFIQPYQWTDVTFLGVARGPGGFTGTRIGVVTARTLAQQLNIPLFGVSSLAALAQFTLDRAPTTAPLAVTLAAQRGLLFTALYQPTTQGVTPRRAEQVLTPAAWEDCLADYGGDLVRLSAPSGLGNTAPQVLFLAEQRWQRGERPRWDSVLPYYGQHPVTPNQ
ncbi:MAG: tRNA (adenosine(37)-N6)-threonylcarbamoyltransferase complex dimerization subunit type 1 TsaB [Cyanobacteria bacterium REEB459]|nr:tRNA (adenosine(37)-N6)-threonylcarbamoyltransferase complex dimerization subunit type 1 TsaB [Cyanobacteria bacterium REEB459]